MLEATPQQIDQMISAAQRALFRAGVDHDPTNLSDYARCYAERYGHDAGEFAEHAAILFAIPAEDLVDSVDAATIAGIPIDEWPVTGRPRPVRSVPSELWRRDELTRMTAHYDSTRPPKDCSRMGRAISSYRTSGLLKRTATKYGIDPAYLKQVLIADGCYRSDRARPVSGGLPSLGRQR